MSSSASSSRQEEADSSSVQAEQPETSRNDEEERRKERKRKMKNNNLSKKIKKMKRLIPTLLRTLDEMALREIDIFAEEADEVTDAHQRTEAKIKQKIIAYRKFIAKNDGDDEYVRDGRQAVEDRLIITDTGHQALNDAMTDFVNWDNGKSRPQRRCYSAEHGNNYVEHFQQPSLEMVRETILKLHETYPTRFPSISSEIAELAESTVLKVCKAIKKRQVQDHQQNLADTEEWCLQNDQQPPTEDAQKAVAENPLLTTTDINYSAATAKIVEAIVAGEFKDVSEDPAGETTEANVERDEEEGEYDDDEEEETDGDDGSQKNGDNGHCQASSSRAVADEKDDDDDIMCLSESDNEDEDEEDDEDSAEDGGNEEAKEVSDDDDLMILN